MLEHVLRRTRFCTKHQNGTESQEIQCIMGSPQGLLEPALSEIAACRMESVEVRRFCYGTMKAVLERFYYRKSFGSDGVVRCSLLKEPESTAGEIMSRKAVNANLKYYDVAQRALAARPQSSVKYYKRAFDRGLKRQKAVSVNNSNGECSLMMKGPGKV